MPAKLRAIHALTEGAIQPERALADKIPTESVAPLVTTRGTDHASESLTDLTLHRIERWGGRLAATHLADAALNQFPQLGIKPSEELIEAAYQTAEKRFFAEPLGYERLLGLKEEAFTIAEIKEMGHNPFSGRFLKEALAENFGGFNPAQVLKEEALTGTKFLNRTLWQANCCSIFLNLKDGARKIVTFLGAGFVALLSAVDIVEKTLKHYEQEEVKKSLGQQTQKQAVKNTAKYCIKTSLASVLTWEASNIGFKVGKALLIIVPKPPILQTACKILAGVLVGSLFGASVNQIVRGILSKDQ
jgi:hypothetical protein